MTARESPRRHLDLPAEHLRTLAAAYPAEFPVLLDSAAEGPLATRSLLAAMPSGWLALDADDALRCGGEVPEALRSLEGTRGGFLRALDLWWREVHAQMPAGRSIAGGWVVFLGYELAAEIEPRLRLPRAALPWRAYAVRVQACLSHDARREGVHIEVASHSGHRADDHALLTRVEALAAQAIAIASPAAACGAAVDEESPHLFLARVERAQEHIRAGDLYQANVSRWWRVEPAPEALAGAALYERLRTANPAPFAAFAQFRGLDILSSSPERLLRIDGRIASTRPIAGTRPRSREVAAEAGEIAALAAHPKERAEHVMLLDLERNDLGRVCEAGSVSVDEYMVVESYAHVHHIVSNVRGTLRAGVTPIDALRAVFPGGTITGCPKIRSMEIIAALEGEGRGAYTGSIGWLTPSGDADFNILIRTLTVTNERIEARAGAGIVADSIPERELDETRAKARGLLAAIGASS
jgi:anthranilate synthase component 1